MKHKYWGGREWVLLNIFFFFSNLAEFKIVLFFGLVFFQRSNLVGHFNSYGDKIKWDKIQSQLVTGNLQKSYKFGRKRLLHV